jgi:hypothetical protein
MRIYTSILLVMFAAIIILTHLSIKYHPFVTILDHKYLIANALIVMLLPLRDVLQAAGGRRASLVVLGMSLVIVYFIRVDYAIVGAAAAALFWTEVFDFALYAYFKRFGWAVGMIVSDVLSAPVLALIYRWLTESPVVLDKDDLAQKYVVLACIYLVLIFVHTPRAFKEAGISKWSLPSFGG